MCASIVQARRWVVSVSVSSELQASFSLSGQPTRSHDRHGRTIFRHACWMDLEGIVSKRIGSRYVSGRTRAWLKTKNPDFQRLTVDRLDEGVAFLPLTFRPRSTLLRSAFAMRVVVAIAGGGAVYRR